MPDALRFVANADAQVEVLPWGPHEWLSRPGLTDAEQLHDSLNDLDRRILKEAFRQARKLQTRLALDYHL